MRRWGVYRCWQGQASTMEPELVERYRRKGSAEQVAARLSLVAPPGGWFEVRRIESRKDA